MCASQLIHVWTAQVLQSLAQQALALGAEKLEPQEMLAQWGSNFEHVGQCDIPTRTRRCCRA